MTTREAMEIASKNGFISLYNQGKKDGIHDFAEWLIKYKVIPDGAMEELMRDYEGETAQK